MKIKKSIVLIFVSVLALSLFSPGSVMAKGYSAPLMEDQVVFGSNFVLKSGEVLDGSLIVFGGNADLKAESFVEGDVVLLGGNLRAGGEIDGNLIALGGSVALESTAIVRGDLVAPGASLRRDPGAVVEGEVLTEGGPVQIDLPEFSEFTDVRVWPFDRRIEVTPFWSITGFLFFLFRSFALSALAVLVVLFLPEHTQRTARAAARQPVISGGLGLLTAVVVPTLLVILVFTILLIPLSLLGFVILIAAGVFGWMAVGLEVGNRIEEAFQQEWTPALTAGIGTLTLTLTAGLVGVIPCIGFLAWVVIGAMGLGAVVLTRFGMKEYLGPEGGKSEVVEAEESGSKPQSSKSGGRKKKGE